MRKSLLLIATLLALTGCDDYNNSVKSFTQSIEERDRANCKPGYVYVYITGAVCIEGYRP